MSFCGSVIDSLLLGVNQVCVTSGSKVFSPFNFVRCSLIFSVESILSFIFTYSSVYQFIWIQLKAPDNSENQISCRSFMLPLCRIEYAGNFYWNASGPLV